MKSLAPAFAFLIFICLSVFIFFRTGNHKLLYSNVAPIIKKNCTTCHYPNGPGGFSLITYADVKQKGSAIKTVIQSKYMPPWKADPVFRHFPNERILTHEEISTISNWVDDGMPPYKTSTTEQNQEYGFNLKLSADYQLTTSDEICVEPNTHDYYVTYPFFIDNKTPLDVLNFELLPANKKIMHHAWLFVVNRTTAYQLFPEWKTQVSASGRNVLDSPMSKKEMLGYLLYLPGMSNLQQVAGAAKKLPADAVLIVDMHYFNKTAETQCDKPLLNIYKSTPTSNREISFAILEEFSIIEKPFVIPPDTVINFVLKAPAAKQDYTLLKITPHMHYLGKSMRVFAVTPTNDTINLVRINDWDFNWQETYSFSPLVTIPKGTTIWASAVYDNTIKNPMNPVLPPIEVHQGFRSQDEMFQIAIEYMPYQKGDEFLKPE